jgi:hypothetical protein
VKLERAGESRYSVLSVPTERGRGRIGNKQPLNDCNKSKEKRCDESDSLIPTIAKSTQFMDIFRAETASVESAAQFLWAIECMSNKKQKSPYSPLSISCLNNY